jgi:hypothetical protein
MKPIAKVQEWVAALAFGRGRLRHRFVAALLRVGKGLSLNNCFDQSAFKLDEGSFGLLVGSVIRAQALKMMTAN